VPYLAIIGDKEVETHTVSVRTRSGGDQKSMSLSEFLVNLNEEIERKVE
jgi:threonyl-tRNA synthetase